MNYPMPQEVLDMHQRIIRHARTRLRHCRECGGPVLFVRNSSGKLVCVDWDEAICFKQLLHQLHVVHQCDAGRATEFFYDEPPDCPGEAAFMEWLTQEGVPHGPLDLTLNVQGEQRHVDVYTTKGGEKPWVTEAAFRSSKADILVFAQQRQTRDGVVVRLTGWMTRKQMLKRGGTVLVKDRRSHVMRRTWPTTKPPFAMSYLRAKVDVEAE